MLICGIDEAGRGPLAGPVVAAAVAFEAGSGVSGAKDSKILSETVRNELFSEIAENCHYYSIGIAGHFEIDEMNILQATMLAMKRALESLKVKPDIVLVDGNYFRLPGGFEKYYDFRTIVKGDSKIHEISCASILAKVTRDKIMREYDKDFPEYDFKSNKGYPTKKHIMAIRQYGRCSIHRASFCKKFVENDNGQQ